MRYAELEDIELMHRLALARTISGGPAATGAEEIVVNGVLAVCDPLGGLYLPETGILVVSDLHLEKGAAFARRGMMLPPYDTIATLNILSAVIARYDPKIVVSLGDNFHDRKGSEHLAADLRSLITTMARGREWVWINGNHDPDGTVDLPGTCTDELFHGGLVFRHEPSLISGPGEARARSPATCIRRPPSAAAKNPSAARVSPATETASSCRPSACLPAASTCVTGPCTACSTARPWSRTSSAATASIRSATAI
jgi:DNA ligase-associated metallophosphoesterase